MCSLYDLGAATPAELQAGSPVQTAAGILRSLVTGEDVQLDLTFKTNGEAKVCARCPPEWDAAESFECVQC